jgi:hypothetical protein
MIMVTSQELWVSLFSFSRLVGVLVVSADPFSPQLAWPQPTASLSIHYCPVSLENPTNSDSRIFLTSSDDIPMFLANSNMG